MDKSILITIISSLLDGLISVVLAGVFIWIWQNKYTERKNRTNILFERVCREEDLFYEKFRIAKNGLYELFVIISNETKEETIKETQAKVFTIVSNMQMCINQIENSTVALNKYKTYMDNIVCKYNEFSSIYTTKRNNLSDEEYLKINSEMTKLKDELLLEIENVDKLYFYKKS